MVDLLVHWVQFWDNLLGFVFWVVWDFGFCIILMGTEGGREEVGLKEKDHEGAERGSRLLYSCTRVCLVVSDIAVLVLHLPLLPSSKQLFLPLN